MRESVLALTKGWDQARVREIVARPRTSRRADHLRRGTRPHPRAPRGGPPRLHRLRIAGGDRRAARPLPRRRRSSRHARRVDDDGRYTGEIELYCYGPSRPPRSRSSRPRKESTSRLVRVLRLGHRHPDARVRRPRGRRQPRPRAGTRRARHEWEVRTFSHGCGCRDRVPTPPPGPTTAVGGIVAAAVGGWRVWWWLRRDPDGRYEAASRRAATAVTGADLLGGDSGEGDENEEEKQLLHGAGS